MALAEEASRALSKKTAAGGGVPAPGRANRIARRKAPRARGAAAPGKGRKLSRSRKPEGMSLEQWQIELRRQYGREQNFRVRNLGSEPIFSEFEVTNPETKRTYRVAIRGAGLGENYCSCPDFAVNTLGTCKHIEFVLGRLMKRRGAARLLAAGHRPAFSEVYLQYGARREVVFQPGTECPEPLRRLAAEWFDQRGRLRGEAVSTFHRFLAEAGRFEGHELRCYPDALAMVAELRDRARLREAVDRAFPRGARSAAFKRLLRVPLYPYQCEGALFAARAGRCLIADDMGLGKTIQAIAAAEILARLAGIERVLIVAPTSLKHQWKREIEKFTRREALVVEGLSPRRAAAYAADGFYKITNYDVVHRDLEPIRRWQPDLIILDEAQRIKNWQTRTAQSIKRLESRFAIVLTGTPLENRLEELHSIVEFVDRFRLGPMFRFLAEHQHVDDHGRVVGYHNLSGISKSLEPILLRRTKQAVLAQLPERLEKRFFVPMTPQQQALHDENREVVARLVAKWRRWGYLSEADQLRLRIALQNMRMACNSTYLLDKQTDFGVKADEMADLFGEVFEDGESKVVVFSQWTRMHELIIRRLEQRRWDFVLFHGGVPGPRRKDLIRRFREDPKCRLFLSTDAGGVGLNLQHANVVVNVDQPWNPAVLEQRIGRVHRLGQRRPVRVVHFIAQHTIEEGMLALLAFKKSVFAGVLDAGDDEVFLGKTRLKQFMETVEQATGAISPALPGQLTGQLTGETDDDGRAAGEPLGALAGEAAAPRPEPPGKPSPARIPGPSAPPVLPVPGETLVAAKGGGAAAVAGLDPAWAEVVRAGLTLVEQLARALGPGGGAASTGSTASPGALASTVAGLVQRDAQTGEAFLRLPMPDPDRLRTIVQWVAALTGTE